MFKVSNSKVKTWRRCHYAYHLKYVEKLRRKAKSRPLTFGDLFHQMIEAHANDDNPFQILDDIDPRKLRLFEVEKEMYGDLIADLRVIMTEYLEHWGPESLQYVRLKRKSAEHFFEIDIGDDLIITGKIDGYVRTPNKLTWLIEHKTFSNMPNEDQHWRNVQSVLYTRITEMLGWVNIEGTCWDYIRSKPPAYPQILKNGELSKRGLDTLPTRLLEFAREHNLKVDKHTMESATKNRQRYFQRIFTPTKRGLVDKVFNDFLETAREARDLHGKSKSKNIDRHCDWCEFEPICRAELRGDDTSFIRKRDYYVSESDEPITTKRDITAHPPSVRHKTKFKHGGLRTKRNG